MTGSPGIQLPWPTLVRQANRSRVLFLLFQAYHLAMLWLMVEPMRLETLMVSAVLNIIAYGGLLFSEFRSSPAGLTPFITYLIAGLLRIGLGAFHLAMIYASGLFYELRVGRFPVDADLLYGQFLLTAADWLFIASYCLVDRNLSVAAGTMMPQRHLSVRTTLLSIALCLAVGWFFKLLAVLGISMVRTSFLPKLMATVLPVAASYLMLVFSESQTRYKTWIRWGAYGFVLLDCALSLGGYMKSGVLIAGLPIVFYKVNQLRADWGRGDLVQTFKRMVPLAITLLGVALVFFPFNEIRRSRGDSQRVESYPVLPDLVAALEGAIPGTDAFRETHEFPRRGFWGLVQRHCIGATAACFYRLTIIYGTLEGEFFLDEIVSLVPRILWSEKPIFRPGAKCSAVLGLASYEEKATTSTDAGAIAGALFFNWGWPAVILGMLINGALMAYFCRIAMPRMKHNPAAAAGCTLLFVETLRYFESSFGGNINLFFLLFVVVCPLMIFWEKLVHATPAAGIRWGSGVSPVGAPSSLR